MNQLTPSSKFRIPIIGIIAFAGLLISIVAIFVFKAAIGLVLNYGFIAAILMSHFWMHGGHGNHSKHQEHADPTNSADHFHLVPVENDDQ